MCWRECSFCCDVKQLQQRKRETASHQIPNQQGHQCAVEQVAYNGGRDQADQCHDGRLHCGSRPGNMGEGLQGHGVEVAEREAKRKEHDGVETEEPRQLQPAGRDVGDQCNDAPQAMCR